MTQQVLDTIAIDGWQHWLAQLAPILPPGLAEEIGLELKRESTANYRGWRAHWQIEQGRLLLAELKVFGYLRDREGPDAWRSRHGLPRDISFQEIFGTNPPIFADWVTTTLDCVRSGDDSQYRREDFGVSGPQTRLIGIEKGLVVSDETVPNPEWDPERSERRRHQAERDKAIKAADDMLARRQSMQTKAAATVSGMSEGDALPSRCADRVHAYLCHRGVDPVLVEAIAEDFRHVLDCEVIVQDGDGLSLSWPEFRARVRKELEKGLNFLIVLLNEHFSGPVYKQTLSTIETVEYGLPASQVVRIGDCEGIEERLGVCDVSPVMTQAERRAAIEKAQGRPIR